MNFSELNPLLSGLSTLSGFTDTHELTFICPLCKNQISIRVRFNIKEDVVRVVWNLKIPEKFDNWNVTIEPSILTHHLKRTPKGDIRCPVHITIENGQVFNR